VAQEAPSYSVVFFMGSQSGHPLSAVNYLHGHASALLLLWAYLSATSQQYSSVTTRTSQECDLYSPTLQHSHCLVC
jgi:hypothetical protein